MILCLLLPYITHMHSIPKDHSHILPITMHTSATATIKNKISVLVLQVVEPVMVITLIINKQMK